MASFTAEYRDFELPWRPAPPVAPDIRATAIGLAASPVRAMADLLARRKPGSDAEALKLLRHAFPDFPLSARIVALAHMPR